MGKPIMGAPSNLQVEHFANLPRHACARNLNHRYRASLLKEASHYPSCHQVAMIGCSILLLSQCMAATASNVSNHMSFRASFPSNANCSIRDVCVYRDAASIPIHVEGRYACRFANGTMITIRKPVQDISPGLLKEPGCHDVNTWQPFVQHSIKRRATFLSSSEHSDERTLLRLDREVNDDVGKSRNARRKKHRIFHIVIPARPPQPETIHENPFANPLDADPLDEFARNLDIFVPVGG
jgi:hypothetical protein